MFVGFWLQGSECGKDRAWPPVIWQWGLPNDAEVSS